MKKENSNKSLIPKSSGKSCVTTRQPSRQRMDSPAECVTICAMPILQTSPITQPRVRYTR